MTLFRTCADGIMRYPLSDAAEVSRIFCRRIYNSKFCQKVPQWRSREQKPYFFMFFPYVGRLHVNSIHEYVFYVPHSLCMNVIWLNIIFILYMMFILYIFFRALSIYVRSKIFHLILLITGYFSCDQ